MAKKYTVMIFDTTKYGKSRTLSITTRPFWAIGVSFVLLLAISVASCFFAYKFYQEKELLEAKAGYNTEFDRQLAAYTQRLEEINKKIASLDELEFKVRDLVAAQSGERVVKQVAVGGKEVDILKDYFAVSDRREAEFFDNLNDTLLVMSSEIEKRETSLSELVDYLEEQRLIMLSTPTIWPVKGWVSSPFGFRSSPFSGRRVFHEGLDIAARYGLDIHATAKGIVVYAGDKAGYGKIVTIDHGYGYMTRYSHNSRITVKVGD
ncbi:MAG: M23 family metallopeptidase, partial [Deferribacterales bacterium]|nr:M23 family metallopeptidase [Deferribacterales bacterium]